MQPFPQPQIKHLPPENGGWRLRVPINATTVLIPGGTGTGKDLIAAILDLYPSTLRARMHKLGIIRPETKEPD